MYFESLKDGPHRRTFLPSALLHVLAMVLSILLWKASPALQARVRSSVALVIPARDTPPTATKTPVTQTAATQTPHRTDLPVRRFEFVPPQTVTPANLVTLPPPPMAPPSRPVPAMALPVEVPVPFPPPKGPPQPTTGLFAAAESHRDSTPPPTPQIASAGFSAPTADHSAVAPPVQTATAGFGAPQVARAASVAQASAANAGFTARAVAPPPAVPARPATTTAGAGFSGPTAAQPAANPTRTTSSVTGFSTPAASPPPATASPTVKSGSFATASVQFPTVRHRAETAPPTEVEILYKPKPVYTEEARRLKIEGEVLLEVIFTASGEVKVLRVSKGLGHGLDEAAIQAAAHIRFKPAERDGSKVDSTATARITFSLAF